MIELAGNACIYCVVNEILNKLTASPPVCVAGLKNFNIF